LAVILGTNTSYFDLHLAQTEVHCYESIRNTYLNICSVLCTIAITSSIPQF